MKKTFILMTAALALLTVAASCSKDEPNEPEAPTPELSVAPASISATAGAGSYTIAITSNVAWTATDNAEWLTLAPAAGEGNGVITATVTENTALEQRSATVTITAGELTEAVTVTQQPTPTPPHAASTRTWVLGNQTWSDAIQVPECNKDDFEDSTTDPHCRSYTVQDNTYYYYNWTYTDLNAANLCPSPWRIPAEEDFINLDRYFGGSGVNRSNEDPEWIAANYITNWGGAYGGFSISIMTIFIDEYAYYWSSTEGNAEEASNLTFTNQGHVYLYSNNTKAYGMQVRCVK
jgi:uncharacterized protein (TIGR02145 family)